METRLRAIGALIGLAVGDALGAPVEFQDRGTFPPVTGMSAGGRFALMAGQWTDDTAMALCLAESLLTDPSLNPVDLMHKFSLWIEEGHNSSTGRCFGVGRITLQALGRFRRTGDPLAGDNAPKTAGNGSIMRLAPVATLHWRNPAEAARVAVLQGLTTHAAAETTACCELLSEVLCRSIHGAPKDAVLDVAPSATWPQTVRAIAAGSWRDRLPESIDSTGHVVATLEAAIWAFANTGSFKECALAAVNLGHDADTVGAVAGQIAGAHYGLNGIPEEWLTVLYRRDDLLGIADALYRIGIVER